MVDSELVLVRRRRRRRRRRRGVYILVITFGQGIRVRVSEDWYFGALVIWF